MAAYSAALCHLANRFWLKPGNTRDWLALPALWELLEWLRTFNNQPGVTYLVHGEPQAASQLRDLMKKELRWNVQIAEYMERVPVLAT